MTEAPDRIWAKLVPDQFGPSGFGLIVDHAAFDGAVEFVPHAELEAAVLAERERCARLADSVSIIASAFHSDRADARGEAADVIAHAIRSQGEKE